MLRHTKNHSINGFYFSGKWIFYLKNLWLFNVFFFFIHRKLIKCTALNFRPIFNSCRKCTRTWFCAKNAHTINFVSKMHPKLSSFKKCTQYSGCVENTVRIEFVSNIHSEWITCRKCTQNWPFIKKVLIFFYKMQSFSLNQKRIQNSCRKSSQNWVCSENVSKIEFIKKWTRIKFVSKMHSR